MYRKLDNDAWEEYLNKFNSIKDTITVKDFCAENNLNKSQFYYHKKRVEKATESSNIYSIVETAKANNLVVEIYLVYLFDNLSKIDIKDSERLENLMPLSNKIPENMKIKEKK